MVHLVAALQFDQNAINNERVVVHQFIVKVAKVIYLPSGHVDDNCMNRFVVHLSRCFGSVI